MITIRVFLPCVSRRDEIYSELLGSWFDVFPFTLMDLCGLVKATYSKHVFENEPSRKLMETAVADHNQAQAIFRSQLTLSSSTEKDYLGGITNNDTSIKGMLQRYYRETLGEQSLSYNGCNWEDLEQGAEISATSSYKDASMSQLLFDFKDCMLYESCLFRTAKKVSSRVEKPNGIMDHLENLSHEAEVHCEGLNVELLAFQKQSLKWAIERERTPGGIQSYFWAKVPVRVGASNKKSNTKHLYYNPILHRFRDTKPAVVRGGFIAEEMGLGKTVVSLALILKNPAPKFPVSGCPISSLSLKDAPNTHSSEDGIFQSTWDRLLYGKTSSVFPKRGSILTRGTLVICPVSLVGQWIEGMFNLVCLLCVCFIS